MGKRFIILEEERKHIMGLYEQTMVPSELEFKTLYNGGFDKLNTDYEGTWNQGYFIFGNNKIDMTSLPHPKSETPIKMRLELSDTPQYENKDTYEFEDNGEYVSKFKTYNFVVYDNNNKVIMRFKPDNSTGTIKDLIFDDKGNKVDWKTYIQGMKEMGKPKY